MKELKNKAGHVHKFERKVIGKNKNYPIYKCSWPGCTTYFAEDMIAGKESICWRCGEVFMMTPKTLIKRPHCADCVAPPRGFAKTKKRKRIMPTLAEVIANIDELLK